MIKVERINNNEVYFILLNSFFTGYAMIRIIDKMEYVKIGNKKYFI